MKIYLDVSCLSRPFDEQSQSRIRLETEAVTLILTECERGRWQQVSSAMANIEIDAIPDLDRRARVQLLLPDQRVTLTLSEDLFARAEVLGALGFKSADAVHVAADVFLSCDDRLCRVARRRRDQLKMRVANPLDWLKEVGDDNDA